MTKLPYREGVGGLGRVEVSKRALVQRINRALKKDSEILRASRGGNGQAELGEYFIVDCDRNVVNAKHVDLVELAGELEVLKEWEELAD